MEPHTPTEEQQAPPDAILRFYAVGSFLNTGFFLLVYGLGILSMMAISSMPYAEYEALFMDQLQGMLEPDMVPAASVMLGLLHESGVLLLVILFLRTAARFVGVLLMWSGRRRGFHLYAAAQLVGIFAPHIVLPLAYLGLWGPLAAVAMTALYGTQVKHLKLP